MGGVDNRQSSAERQNLHEIWLGTRQVKKFRADTKAFIKQEGLTFDAEGLTRVLQFGNEWVKRHGSLPDSGILTG
jgi:predicted solute-binding protein